MQSQFEFSIGQKLPTDSPDGFDKHRTTLYESLNSFSAPSRDGKELIANGILTDVRFEKEGGDPIDCTDEYKALKDYRANQAQLSEKFNEAERALSDGDLKKFTEIFSDPLISKADREAFLRNSFPSDGEERRAPDDKMLACEARMLRDEYRALTPEERERHLREFRESRIEKSIEDIPDYVRLAASLGYKCATIMQIAMAEPHEDKPPKLDQLQQRVFDRLAELGLQPTIKKVPSGDDRYVWQLTAHW